MRWSNEEDEDIPENFFLHIGADALHRRNCPLIALCIYETGMACHLSQPER